MYTNGGRHVLYYLTQKAPVRCHMDHILAEEVVYVCVRLVQPRDISSFEAGPSYEIPAASQYVY